MLQLDVAHCLAAGGDPVAWIKANPGRINSLHLKDWSPQLEYKAVLGGGAVRWKAIFDAAEKSGGVEFYLIEQEDSPDSYATARECLQAYRKIHV